LKLLIETSKGSKDGDLLLQKSYSTDKIINSKDKIEYIFTAAGYKISKNDEKP